MFLSQKELKEDGFEVPLKQHLKTDNTFRPHKAFNNLTPYQYSLTYINNPKPYKRFWSNTGAK